MPDTLELFQGIDPVIQKTLQDECLNLTLGDDQSELYRITRPPIDLDLLENAIAEFLAIGIEEKLKGEGLRIAITVHAYPELISVRLKAAFENEKIRDVPAARWRIPIRLYWDADDIRPQSK